MRTWAAARVSWLTLMAACGTPSPTGGPLDAVVGQPDAADSGPDVRRMGCTDVDEDGVCAENGDCDDTEPRVYPGATEVCDNGTRDEDCDPGTFGDRDGDGDGYASASCCNLDPVGASVCGPDCDDSDPSVHPSEAESCDGLDNDCDDAIDENVRIPFYRDVDGDGFGVADLVRTGCSAPLGYVLVRGDCDDTLRAVNPGQEDTCNGRDDDCDGQLDDPTCPCSEGETRVCGEPDGMGGFLMRGTCRPGSQVCLGIIGWDGCVNDVRPVTESCNGADDDCDGMTDESLLREYLPDRDSDGYAALGVSPISACAAPAGYIERSDGNDCDDANPMVRPFITETCGTPYDDNCDGSTRDGCTCVPPESQVCGTERGECTIGSQACLPDGIYGACSGVPPAASDSCDHLDNDCDGLFDEPAPARPHSRGFGPHWLGGVVTWPEALALGGPATFWRWGAATSLRYGPGVSGPNHGLLLAPSAGEVASILYDDTAQDIPLAGRTTIAGQVRVTGALGGFRVMVRRSERGPMVGPPSQLGTPYSWGWIFEAAGTPVRLRVLRLDASGARELGAVMAPPTFRVEDSFAYIVNIDPSDDRSTSLQWVWAEAGGAGDNVQVNVRDEDVAYLLGRNGDEVTLVDVAVAGGNPPTGGGMLELYTLSIQRRGGCANGPPLP